MNTPQKQSLSPLSPQTQPLSAANHQDYMVINDNATATAAATAAAATAPSTPGSLTTSPNQATNNQKGNPGVVVQQQQQQQQQQLDEADRFDDEIPLEITESMRTEDNVNIDNNDDNNNSEHRISWMDACMHLIKGNLGPGCLNIPHAFVLSGWLLGSVLFLIVAVQGIYSMYILSYCKDLLVHVQQQQQHHQQQQQSAPTSTTQYSQQKFTFMTVAQHALGSKLHVQIFLFALQVGVCCVFLSLLSTNLKAQLPWLSSFAAVMIITIALLGVVLQRFLKGLRWLSTIANVFMITAISTACVFGITNYRQIMSHDDDDTTIATSDLGDIATFVSAMFFSFEGIGLVLPVENSFTAGYATLEETSNANHRYRKVVLPGAMSMVGILFIAIGISASLGYPDIENGSITAYLKETYPNNVWLDIVNVLVMIAVFLTFPLQLTPAMEVLEEWLYGVDGEEDGGNDCCCCNIARRILPGGGQYHFQIDEEGGGNGNGNGPNNNARIQRVDSNDAHREDSLLESSSHSVEPDDDEDLDGTATTPTSSPRRRRTCCCYYYYQGYLFCLPHWVIQRYMIVFGCAIVVLVVDDLGLLMSLFGAVGQTGLALMPCVIHWNLQRQGVAPKNRMLQVLDVFTIGFSGLVMITGVGFSIQKLLLKKR